MSTVKTSRKEGHQHVVDLSTLEIIVPPSMLDATNEPADNQVPSYDLATGQFTWTDVAFSETDPVFSASPAAGITAQDITNWNDAVTGGIEEAPANGLQYARQDEAWSEISIPDVGIPEPTAAGVDHARNPDGNWYPTNRVFVQATQPVFNRAGDVWIDTSFLSEPQDPEGGTLVLSTLFTSQGNPTGDTLQLTQLRT